MKINFVTILSIIGIIVEICIFDKAPKNIDEVPYVEGYVLDMSNDIVKISKDSTKEIVNIINTIHDKIGELSSDSILKMKNQFDFDEKLFSFKFDGPIITKIYHNIDSAGYAYMKIRYKSGITGRTYRTNCTYFYQIQINDKIVLDYDFLQQSIYKYIILSFFIIIGIGALWNNKDKEVDNFRC